MIKFYLCKHCGNQVEMVHDAGVNPVCCGEPMHEMVPNTTDAAHEKHVPVVSVNGSVVTVSVGSVAHPMAEEHHIGWIVLETCCGVQRKALKPGDEPKAVFLVPEGQKPVAAYAWCNLHGLWKAEI